MKTKCGNKWVFLAAYKEIVSSFSWKTENMMIRPKNYKSNRASEKNSIFKHGWSAMPRSGPLLGSSGMLRLGIGISGLMI